MAKKECQKCGKGLGPLGKPETKVADTSYCPICAPEARKELLEKVNSKVIMTTTNNVDGRNVKRYIDIGSAEVVIGTSVLSEISSSFSDFFGERSKGFESKLQEAKNMAKRKLQYEAYEKGANAIIGIDLDYTEFSGNRIGIIVNGTMVELD